jgi:hypothetical protein
LEEAVERVQAAVEEASARAGAGMVAAGAGGGGGGGGRGGGGRGGGGLVRGGLAGGNRGGGGLAHGGAGGSLAHGGAGNGGGPQSEMIAVANIRNNSTRLIARSAILYVQSHGDFVRIVTGDGRYLLRATLGEIERRWEPYGFIRVHRQYVANLSRAVELRPRLGGTAELVFADGQLIPIARRHVAELGRRLGV